MKTTVEISEAPLERARRQALRSGQPLRALIEQGLRLVLESESGGERYRLPDRSVGEPGAANPLESLSWQDLRGEIYGGRRRFALRTVSKPCLWRD
jgi:hypothetical protein